MTRRGERRGRTATGTGDRVQIDIVRHFRTRVIVEVQLNDIARVRLRTSAPLVLDPYTSNRRTGSFILIDESSNGTVGAGMITDPVA